MKRVIFSNEKLIDKLTSNKYARPIKLEEKLIDALVKVKPTIAAGAVIPLVNNSYALAPVLPRAAAGEVALIKQIEAEEKKEELNSLSDKITLLKSIAANLIDLGLVGVITDKESVTLGVLTLEDIKTLLLLMEQHGSFSCETPYGMVEFCRLVYKVVGKEQMSEQLEDALLYKYKGASSLEYLHDFLSDVSEEVAILALKKNNTLELILIEALNAGDQELANELIDMLGVS